MISCFCRRIKNCLSPSNKIFLKTIASGVDFLGWVNFTDHRVLRTVTKRRMLRRIEAYSTSETIQSYLGLMKYGNTSRLQGELHYIDFAMEL
jgi:hypothetical protein